MQEKKKVNFDEEQIPDIDKKKVSTSHEEKNEHWFLRLILAPLIVALISTVVFGIVVAWVGSDFQKKNSEALQKIASDLQQKNWKEQKKISSQKALQEKVFDKRAEIARDVFYLATIRRQITWRIFSKKTQEKDFTEDWHKSQEIIASFYAVIEEADIFFGYETDQVSKICQKVLKICHDIDYEVARMDFKQVDSAKIEQNINVYDNEIEKLLNVFRNEINVTLNKEILNKLK